MPADESYSSLSWITDEMKNRIRQENEMIENQDMEGAFTLPDNSSFSIVLNSILGKRCNLNPEKLNPTERTLFLCVQIENAGQADSILGFLQEDYPGFAEETVRALEKIGAIQSAAIIRQAIELLPEDGSWFFETSDESSEEQMSKLDRAFSDYPDGFMRDLYRKYAEENKPDLI